MPKMKYNSFPPSLSVEPGVFVTAVDHSNTIFLSVFHSRKEIQALISVGERVVISELGSGSSRSNR